MKKFFQVIETIVLEHLPYFCENAEDAEFKAKEVSAQWHGDDDGEINSFAVYEMDPKQAKEILEMNLEEYDEDDYKQEEG
jgi:hypothetical protein